MNKDIDAIILTSDEPYGQMWHTQLIYADALSKHTKVFYIEPPKKWRFSNLFNGVCAKRIVSPSLFVFNYLNVYPSKWNTTNNAILSKAISKELEAVGAKNILIWHFDPFRSAFNDEVFTSKFKIKRVYHVIDPFYNNPLNKWLSDNCNILALTSPRNRKHYEAYANKTLIIPQAIDFNEHRNYIQKGHAPTFTNKYFVLLGTISQYVDLESLYKLFKDQAYELVIIGRVTDLNNEVPRWERLKALPNVHYKGAMQPKDFYPVLRDAEAGLIIYGDLKKTSISSPLKVLNYLVAGIPVVTNLDCEMEELHEKCIFHRDGLEQLNATLQKIIKAELKFEKEAAEHFLEERSITVSIKKILEKL